MLAAVSIILQLLLSSSCLWPEVPSCSFVALTSLCFTTQPLIASHLRSVRSWCSTPSPQLSAAGSSSFRGALGGCASLLGSAEQPDSIHVLGIPAFPITRFSTYGDLVQSKFQELCISDFVFHSQVCAQITVSTHFPRCPSKCTVFYQLFDDIAYSTIYSELKKKQVLINVNRDISLYFSSPIGRTPLLDFSCTNTGNTPIGKYTAIFAQSLLF